MSEYRPRLPERLESIIETHADQHDKTKPEMLEEMIDAYDNGITGAHNTLEANNSLLSDIHDALNLNAQTTIENGTQPDIESENGTRNNLNYNALSMNHDMTFEKKDENWAVLWDQGLIKHSPKYLIPVIQGLINKYAKGSPMSENMLEHFILGEFGLSEHSVSNYLYEYGPEHNTWHPTIMTDPKFNQQAARKKMIRSKAKYSAAQGGETKTQSKEETRLNGTYTTFESAFDIDALHDLYDDTDKWTDQTGYWMSTAEAREALLEVLEALRQTQYEGGPARRAAPLHEAIAEYANNRGLITHEKEAELNDKMYDKISSDYAA